jgi:hypothetical protein
MRSLFLVLALAACNFQATKFTPAGGGGDDAGGGDDGGGGTAARLSATPDGNIGLGTIVIGQVSATSTITISNDGDESSGAIAITFDDAGLGFALVDDTCTGQILAGHTTCVFGLTFAPTTAAALQTNLHVTADPGGEVSKIVSGTGLLQGAIDIVEDSFDYALLGMGAAPKSTTFTIRNTGQAQIGMPVPSISGDASYTVRGTTCNAPLNQTDTCTVDVEFKPGAVGAKAGSIVITATPGGSDAAQLAGIGFARVSVAKVGDGVGTVTSNPAGITCGTNCSADFTQSPITLNATAGLESSFTGYAKDCAGTTCQLNLNAFKTVDAQFTLKSYPVNVTFISSNPGGNTITSNPPGLTCDPTASACTGNFKFGTSVTLTAVPDSVTGRFGAWTAGPCAGGTGNRSPTCTFTVPSGGLSASASFEWFASLKILRATTNRVTMATTSDGQINCTDIASTAGVCFANFGRGATVTLKYQGNPLTQWTSCKGGPALLFLEAFASGSFCHPPDGVICDTNSCPSSRSCTFTFTAPGDFDSQYDVTCDSLAFQ